MATTSIGFLNAPHRSYSNSNNFRSQGKSMAPQHPFFPMQSNDLSQTQANSFDQSQCDSMDITDHYWDNQISSLRHLSISERDAGDHSSTHSDFSQRSDISRCDSFIQYGNSPLSSTRQVPNERRTSSTPMLHYDNASETVIIETGGIPSRDNNNHPCLVFTLRLLIGLASCSAIAICVYILYCKNDCISKVPAEKKEIIRLPCADLSKQAKSLIDADLEKYRIKSSTDCEVPMGLLLDQMATPGLDIMEAQVKLQADHKGPVLEYSNYNLSMHQQSPRSALVVDGHSLLIQEEGYYFVFFNIQLSYGHKNTSPKCKELRFKTSVTHLLRHRLHSPNKKFTAVLRAEHTCCESCETERSTAFTGGLFHLTRNDSLFLQVSAPKNIGDEGDNFLGMFKMSAMY